MRCKRQSGGTYVSNTTCTYMKSWDGGEDGDFNQWSWLCLSINKLWSIWRRVSIREPWTPCKTWWCSGFWTAQLNLSQTGNNLMLPPLDHRLMYLSRSIQDAYAHSEVPPNPLHCNSQSSRVYNSQHGTCSPHPLLDWLWSWHYSFLDEFNLLRATCEVSKAQRWTEPAIRTTMKQDLWVTCAYEEIECCNIEVHRLHTSIYDEHVLFTTSCVSWAEEGSAIWPVMDYVVHRRPQTLT